MYTKEQIVAHPCKQQGFEKKEATQTDAENRKNSGDKTDRGCESGCVGGCVVCGNKNYNYILHTQIIIIILIFIIIIIDIISNRLSPSLFVWCCLPLPPLGGAAVFFFFFKKKGFFIFYGFSFFFFFNFRVKYLCWVSPEFAWPGFAGVSPEFARVCNGRTIITSMEPLLLWLVFFSPPLVAFVAFSSIGDGLATKPA